MPFFRRREKVEAGLKKTRETFFGRIAGLLSRSTVDEALWEELEEALISADAGAKLTIDLLERVRARAKSAGASTGEDGARHSARRDRVHHARGRSLTSPLL